MMHWEARLESEQNPQHYMEIQIQDCTEDEAVRLAQRQNMKYSLEYSRPLYKLVNLERVNG